MNVSKGNQKIANIVGRLMEAKASYYRGAPEMPDSLFNALEERLRGLDPDNAYFRVAVGYSAGQLQKPIKHLHPMGSLRKIKKVEELRKWTKETGKRFVVTPKLDGLAGGLVYEDGILASAATRGDGATGENILAHVLVVASVPKFIPHQGRCQIRGEFVILKKDFEEICKTEKLANARNAAAGALNPRGDPLAAAKRRLTFIAYRYIGDDDSTYVRQLELCQSFGFQVVPHGVYDSDTDDWLEVLLAEAESDKAKHICDTDGLVFRKNRESGDDLENLIPLESIAWKWEAETAQTEVVEVVWEMGRTKRLVPVAIVNPVQLSGATVKRCTLHNYQNVIDNGIGAGAVIEMQRSGEVIPKCCQVIERVAPVIPVECPLCAGALRVEGADLRCINDECRSLEKEIRHFALLAGIDGLGTGTIGRIIEAGMVQNVADVLSLPGKDGRIAKMGDKDWANLIASIRSAKVSERHIYACLALPAIGESTSETLFELFKDGASEIAIMDPGQFTTKLGGAPGFTEKSAKQICALLADEALPKQIEAIGRIAVRTIAVSEALKGLVFCVTGKTSVPRADIEETIRKNGGEIGNVAKREGMVLVCNDPESESSKMVKAKRLGVEIWSEQKLNERITK